MLRSVRVGEGHDFVDAVQHNGVALGQGTLGQVCAAQDFDLTVDFGRHGQGCGLVRADEHYLAVAAMLGLRKQVCGSEGGVGRSIDDDHHFRRSCRHVDGYCAAAKHLLGCGNILIAGTEDLVHLRYTFRAVGHCRDRLGSSDAEDALYAAV